MIMMAKFICYLFSLFAFAFCDLSLTEKSFRGKVPRCPRLSLENGRVRLRTRSGRIAYFRCQPHFSLVGRPYAYCQKGKWSSKPLCVSSNCRRPPAPRHVTVEERQHAAHLVFSCPEGYLLRGSPTLICQNGRWNGTVPTCESTARLVNERCDFESGLCGWSQSVKDDTDWLLGSGKTATDYTGPSHDHTYGPGRKGHYLYLESLDELYNHSPFARLHSPALSPRVSQTSCLQFYYHSYGVSIGQLSVFVKPLPSPSLTPETMPETFDVPLFSSRGNKGDKWLAANLTLPDMDSNFQIVIEGSMGEGFLGDLAIDDLKIFQCKRFHLEVFVPEPTLSTTTKLQPTTTTQSSKPSKALLEKILRDLDQGKANSDIDKKSWKSMNGGENEIVYRDVSPALLGAKVEKTQNTEALYITGALLFGVTVFTVLLGIGCYLRKYRASLSLSQES